MKNIPLIRCHKVPISVIFFSLLFSPALISAITADFSGGDGNTLPDQWQGTAGNGWVDAWARRIGSNSISTFGVQNSNPFGSGGNYLEVNYAKTAAAGSNRTGVARQFQNSGPSGINLTKPYEIQFQFRVDSLTGWDASTDQFAFSSEATTTIGGLGTDAPWALWLRGDNGWSVGDGNGVGGVTYLNFSSLGLSTVTVGQIYAIHVFVDPLAQGYDLTITAGVDTYRASDLNGGELLGFRTNATAADANVLQYRVLMGGATDAVTWSLDSIAVVPEPGSAFLCLGALSYFLLRRRPTS